MSIRPNQSLPSGAPPAKKPTASSTISTPTNEDLLRIAPTIKMCHETTNKVIRLSASFTKALPDLLLHGSNADPHNLSLMNDLTTVYAHYLSIVNGLALFIDPDNKTPCPFKCSAPKSHPLAEKATDTADLPVDKVSASDSATSTDSMVLDPPAPLTPRPTYASVAVASQPPTALPTKPISTSLHSRPKVQAPKAPVLNPVRLVVRPSQTSFKAKPFAMILINGPAEPYRRLTLALSLSPSTKDVKLLGVHVNRSQNLIVSLPHGTSEATVSNVITVIHSCFSSLVCFPLLITQDVAWTKFMVSSVPSRLNPGAPTYSEEEVKTSFLLNPAVQALSIMRPPRWIRNPASITGAHSSFTFSFVDPDGSLGRSLAKSRLFTFGEPVHLKRWTDKPRQTRGANSN